MRHGVEEREERFLLADEALATQHLAAQPPPGYPTSGDFEEHVLRRWALALVALVAMASKTFGDDKPVIVQAADTFPATLGYAYLAAATTAAGVLTGVITKLWVALGAKDKATQDAID